MVLDKPCMLPTCSKMLQTTLECIQNNEIYCTARFAHGTQSPTWSWTSRACSRHAPVGVQNALKSIHIKKIDCTACLAHGTHAPILFWTSRACSLHVRNPRKCFIMLVHKQKALLRDSHGQLPGVGRSLTKRDLCSEKATIVRQPPE